MTSRPGREVRASQDGLAYVAWVPDALPPQLEFDTQLISVLTEAASALGELAGTGRNLPDPHLLLNPFLRKEAVLSSRIEGTQATITDLYAYEAQVPLRGSGEGPGDVREVVNYVAALNAGLQSIEHRPISLSLITQLHANLMRNVRGRELTPGAFRERQNLIGASGATLTTATHVPPPPLQMRDCLASLEAYLRLETTDHPKLIRLALIHYQFEAIHPFNDGNGRVGRLLVSLLVGYWKLLPLPLLYLSAYFEQHRREYYDRLQAVTETGNWRDWIIFFLQGVAEQAEDATLRAKRLYDLRESLRSHYALERGSAVTLRLVDSLFQQPVLTIGSAAAAIGCSYHLTRRHVHKLVDSGILKPFGTQGHQDLFLAAAILAAVED